MRIVIYATFFYQFDAVIKINQIRVVLKPNALKCVCMSITLHWICAFRCLDWPHAHTKYATEKKQQTNIYHFSRGDEYDFFLHLRVRTPVNSWNISISVLKLRRLCQIRKHLICFFIAKNHFGLRVRYWGERFLEIDPVFKTHCCCIMRKTKTTFQWTLKS